jgi:hypothetical protein
MRTASLEWLTYQRKIETPGEISALAVELDALPAPERTLVKCSLEGTLFGLDYEPLGQLIEIVEGRFLYGRCDAERLVPDHEGPEWIEHLPEGYLREAACNLLHDAAADPVASAALREFSKLWREAVQ